MCGLQPLTDRKNQYPCSFSLGMHYCACGETEQREATLLTLSVNEDISVG